MRFYFYRKLSAKLHDTGKIKELLNKIQDNLNGLHSRSIAKSGEN